VAERVPAGDQTATSAVVLLMVKSVCVLVARVCARKKERSGVEDGDGPLRRKDNSTQGSRHRLRVRLRCREKPAKSQPHLCIYLIRKHIQTKKKQKLKKKKKTPT
jgi:hypothetical protein